MPAADSTAEVTSLLEHWEKDFNSSDVSALLSKTTTTADGVVLTLNSLLTRLAEIVERETEAWYKMDPDPFDDRHPGRADPNCALGHVLKALFKNDSFMTKIVSTYLLSRDAVSDGSELHTNLNELHTISCRLLLDIMPGLETSVIFQK